MMSHGQTDMVSKTGFLILLPKERLRGDKPFQIKDGSCTKD
jgi:hypothetical protein